MAPVPGEASRVQLVPWRRYTWARLERYMQNGAIKRILGFTHSLKIENQYFFLTISKVLL